MRSWRDARGFTLLEFVVVVALSAALIGMTAILLTKGRAAANFSTTQERIRVITAGLSEARMFRNSLPAQDTISTTWPAGLTSYIEADFRAGGVYEHGYQCSSNSVTLQTPPFESNAAAVATMNKLIDQNVCTAGSSVPNNGNQINCVLGTFAGSAQCVAASGG